MAYKPTARLAFLIAAIGFSTNLIWENLQAPLYGYQYANLLQHLPMCLFATVGDVIFIFLLYAVIALYRIDWFWVKLIRVKDVIALVVLGEAGAVMVEKIALPMFAWSYASKMPIIPVLNVGVTPVMQMLFLPIFTFWAANKIMKHNRFT